jgi:large subunit ribosomal protein L22
MATKKTKKQDIQKNDQKAEARAVLRYLRIAPRKVRLVANLIKGKSVNDAQAQLMLNPKRSAVPLLKLLNSAIENAKAKNMNVEKLIVVDIRVDKGPMLKRWMPRAQGRATPIHKHTSHILIVLKESEKSVESKFVIEAGKVKKEKKEKTSPKHSQKEKGGGESAKEKEILKKADDKEEKKKTVKEEIKKEELEGKKENKGSQKGFIQKMFRRKSV